MSKGVWHSCADLGTGTLRVIIIEIFVLKWQSGTSWLHVSHLFCLKVFEIWIILEAVMNSNKWRTLIMFIFLTYSISII